jgi:DinB superfamily
MNIKMFKELLWFQFGAAIDMLGNAIKLCPDKVWGDRTRKPEFWYVAFHTLFWLDLYLSDGVKGFTPPAPYTLDELDPAGLLPERVYTKEEIQSYLEHGRNKCKKQIAALTDEKANQRGGFKWIEGSVAELHLYNLRHVQHHTGQLNLILRQTINSAPRWISRAKN